MICDDLARDLDPLLDHELGAESEDLLRQHLRTCVICRRRAADREALGRMVRSAPYHAAPERLRTQLSRQLKRSRTTRRVLTWAAAAMLAVSVGGGTIAVRSMRPDPDTGADSVMAAVVDGHVRSLMADHLFDVQSTDQHTVKPWFAGKLDFSPPVSDLAPLGYPLVGGRLDYVSGRPVAALVYQRQKHAINVFVWPASESAPATITTRSVRGFHLRHWIRDGMSFWVVSELNDAELTEFARALQQQ
jgi:anti-sigma factor RsiW